MKASCDTVVHDAARVIEAVRRYLPFYAGDFAPARTDQISELLKRSGCALQIFPFPLDEDGQPIDAAFVMPLLNGVNIICVDQAAPRKDRQYAIRHELTHVFADEVREMTYLSDRDYMSASERLADLVALADLVPGWFIRMLRRAGEGWDSVGKEVRGYVLDYADDRPQQWAADRAELRLRLFRDSGI